jgi:class 3 adenylate cyclase/tetratricopeptide (TPR) repeat protein
MDDSPAGIEAAIAALEAQRDVLGDAVADIALATLREKLATASARAQGSDQQLRAVTVLFMDVVGSTVLTRQLDPEDVHAVMDGALESFTSIVQAHDGRVLQYAGDSLLAAWGTREAHEDDAEHAVRAGLDILAQAREQSARVARLHRFDGFDVRVGIHTGTVLLGGGVDAGNTIRGIAVNVAARMEQTAPPGGLRISHSTYRQVRGVFDVSEEPLIEVKGIAQPVRSYLVQRAKPRAFRSAERGVEGARTRMVGRDAEFARLTETFDAVLEDRTLSTVTLVGEAGLGKTRLMLEFQHWIELRPQTLWYFQARARVHGSSVPYGLLRDLFAWRFEIADSDPAAVARDKLARGFGSVFGDRAEEQTALVGQLIGLNYADSPFIAGIATDARQIRDRAVHAAAQYFRLLLEGGGDGIVVLLDDLQWADDGSLDFVNHVGQACRDLPVMVMCLTRPALFERRPLWGSGQGNHERITLAPLSRRGSRELADEILRRIDPVPAALRELVTSSAEGNPYFIEELVAMLIEDGVIVTHLDEDDEHWHVDADRLLEVHVPPTLAALLQTRLDGLPPAERKALQQASVIGHVFWDEPLARIEASSIGALDAITRRELAHCRETTSFDGTHEYVFKHHLLHQVSYESVLKRQKREQHRLTAEWLVARSAGGNAQFNNLIAHHFERAGDLASAAVYLGRAGQDAARAYANAEALSCLGRALALTPEEAHEARFDLLVARIVVLSNIGRRVEQETDVAALEHLAHTMGDDSRRARAAGFRGSLSVATGNYRAACEAGAQAVAWAEAAGAPDAALSARMNWARALHFIGDPGAQWHSEQSLALARQAGDRRLESAALNQLGIVARKQGHYAEARAHYQRALQLARTNGDRAMESGVLNNMGDIERYLGHHEAALQHLRAGRRVCVEIGQRMSESYVLCNLAQVAQACGDAAAALDWGTQAEALAREVSDPDLHASILKTMGDAHAAAGDAAAAERAYDQSLAMFRDIGRTTMLAEPQAGLASLALDAGRLDAALAHVEKIIGRLDAGSSLEGTEDPLWILLTCHRVLRAAGAPRDEEFLVLAHTRLMEQAQALDEPERETFLHDVPSHRATVAAWNETPATKETG